uniref:Uncharacterized protein n=1 Tax=viral metagenome TaxID=1070528 RepID=A0A6C0B953_9ZZZZ
MSQFPSIQAITTIETMPFKNWDGTYVGDASVIKKTKGKSFLSGFGSVDNFLYRIQKSTLDNELREEPLKQDYKDLFPDIVEEHKEIELLKNPKTGGRKKTKKTKKHKKRSRRTKINKK